MKKNVLTIMAVLPFVLFLATTNVKASEGYIELYNQEGGDARCYGLSVLMPSLTYQILLTCREITYPGNSDQFNYVVWARQSGQTSNERLGQLGVGKVELDTKNNFNEIFVTRESTSNPRTPSNTVVLSGNVNQISFLDKPQQVEEDNIIDQNTASPTPTATPSKSLFSRIFTIGSLVPFVGVVLLLGLVFILTRK